MGADPSSYHRASENPPTRSAFPSLSTEFSPTSAPKLQTGFKELMSVLQPVLRIIKSCSDTCSKIKEWFEPFFWVLVGHHRRLRGSQYS